MGPFKNVFSLKVQRNHPRLDVMDLEDWCGDAAASREAEDVVSTFQISDVI